ncbi:MAG TPA: nickel-binding protein [Myxococcota bacterium]|nr:nickel-binding protein [Myxococcota bacterium]
MSLFLVELYVSRADPGAARRWCRDARRAAEDLTRSGTPVRYQRSIFVPDDETCFCLFEAENADAVRAAACRAELPFQRIAEAQLEVD